MSRLYHVEVVTMGDKTSNFEDEGCARDLLASVIGCLGNKGLGFDTLEKIPVKLIQNLNGNVVKLKEEGNAIRVEVNWKNCTCEHAITAEKIDIEKLKKFLAELWPKIGLEIS